MYANFTTMIKPIGIFLIGIGIIMLIWSSFTYTKRENVVDAGPVHISADRQKTVSWPPMVGAVVLVAGVAMVVVGRKRN